MHVVNPQDLEYHFVETRDRCLEVKGLVNQAVCLVEIYVDIFGETFVYPSVTHWLHLHLPPCIRLQLLHIPVHVHSVLENVVAMPFLDVRSTVEHLPTIFYDLGGQVMQLYLFLLGALDIKPVTFEHHAVILPQHFHLLLRLRLVALTVDGRNALATVEEHRHPIDAYRMETRAVITHHHTILHIFQSCTRADFGAKRSDLIIFLFHPLMNVNGVNEPLNLEHMHQNPMVFHLLILHHRHRLRQYMRDHGAELVKVKPTVNHDQLLQQHRYLRMYVRRHVYVRIVQYFGLKLVDRLSGQLQVQLLLHFRQVVDWLLVEYAVLVQSVVERVLAQLASQRILDPFLTHNRVWNVTQIWLQLGQIDLTCQDQTGLLLQLRQLAQLTITGQDNRMPTVTVDLLHQFL